MVDVGGRYAKHDVLLANLKENAFELKHLLVKINNHWALEDCFYRFYHYSFKVFYLQAHTEEIVAGLKKLLPDEPLNQWFLDIVAEGTGKKFDMKETNKNWVKETKPIVDAALHARYFLELAVMYEEKFKDLNKAPNSLPSGWASLLYLFNIR